MIFSILPKFFLLRLFAKILSDMKSPIYYFFWLWVIGQEYVALCPITHNLLQVSSLGLACHCKLARQLGKAAGSKSAQVAIGIFEYSFLGKWKSGLL
jgi:hypothetical protein